MRSGFVNRGSRFDSELELHCEEAGRPGSLISYPFRVQLSASQLLVRITTVVNYPDKIDYSGSNPDEPTYWKEA